jgi:hypothetical protein
MNIFKDLSLESKKNKKILSLLCSNIKILLELYQQKIDNLEKENAELKKENAKLKTTYVENEKNINNIITVVRNITYKTQKKIEEVKLK